MTSSVDRRGVRVTALSTGHRATDHRIFDKEGRTLAEAGFAVSVLAAHPHPERRDGVELLPLPVYKDRLRRFLLGPWQAIRMVRRQRSVVVHLHDAELLAIAPLLKLLRTPVVIYAVHEDYANMMMHRDWIPRPLRPAVRTLVAALERLLVLSVDGVVAPTDPLAHRFPRRPSIAAYNLPTRRFIALAGEGAPPPSERSIDVVHVGVLSRQRLEFLGETLRLLLERRPGTRVRIAGLPDEQRTALLELTGPTGVEVLGTVPHEEVGRIVRDARVGVNVHPYLHDHLKVAVPVKVFEYMAAGCAVVTSRLPELDRLLGPTAEEISLVPDPEPARYAEAIAAWLDDPQRLESVSPRLQESVRDRHSWDSEGRKLLGLYDELLSEHART